jgi:hypothetical protein
MQVQDFPLLALQPTTAPRAGGWQGGLFIQSVTKWMMVECHVVHAAGCTQVLEQPQLGHIQET